MGWYIIDKDYIDEFKKLGYSPRCTYCGQDIKGGEKVIFTDFANGKAEHALCYWKALENEKQPS